MPTTDTAEQPLWRLSWEQSDIERRLGFRGAHFTGVNIGLTFVAAILLTAIIYGGLYPLMDTRLGEMFWARGSVPPVITFLSCWSLAILVVKWTKVAFQERALPLQVVPRSANFCLTPTTAHIVLDKMYDLVDNPKHFILFNRIELALSNLKNIGRIGDVDDILRSQAENDENQVESTYTLIRGFLWAIPVLGFIGTVIGLSEAIGNFGTLLGESAELEQIKSGLQQVTGGLSLAFETTLLALVMALVLHLLMTALKKREESLLDQCLDYGLRHVVSRLRLENYDQLPPGDTEG